MTFIKWHWPSSSTGLPTYWGSFVLMALAFLLPPMMFEFVHDCACSMDHSCSFYVTLILYILQVVTSSTAWDHVPPHLKPSFNVLVQLLMCSKAESTIRAYLAKIKAFSSWCRNKRIPFQLPIRSSVAFWYLANYFEKSKSGSSLTLVHAALKWFHSLVPGPNPFDSTVCHNILESSKRSRTTPRLPLLLTWLRRLLINMPTLTLILVI